ncbi:MAG TPA: beta-L-arabinofuranosidase domain-containing protein, partial [Phycisphaerae bacterium]|nr:beta-L-arabinofuranosidase domain-containing protein [Phycisphaerae bacterium]
MTISRHASVLAVVTACTCAAAWGAEQPLIQSVPIKAVHLSDAFWAPRLETIRTSTLPALLERLQSAGRLNNFVNAAAAMKGQAGQAAVTYPYEDADVYIVVEAASNSLAMHADPKLQGQVEEIIAKIAAAQEPDGYLYTARTVNPASPPAFAGGQRWVNEKADSYELSNLGYLYSAAAAHFQATGSRSLLEVAMKSADLLDKTFGEGKQAIYPGHEGVEMGLVKLSQATGEKRYLALAKYFVEQRGPAGAPATAAAAAGRGGGGGGGRGR